MVFSNVAHFDIYASTLYMGEWIYFQIVSLPFAIIYSSYVEPPLGTELHNVCEKGHSMYDNMCMRFFVAVSATIVKGLTNLCILPGVPGVPGVYAIPQRLANKLCVLENVQIVCSRIHFLQIWLKNGCPILCLK